MTEAKIKLGIYRHFKGNQYQVLGQVRHSETEETLVLYRPLYGEGALWVRPIELFSDTKNLDGIEIQRFTYVGPASQPDTFDIEANT